MMEQLSETLAIINCYTNLSVSFNRDRINLKTFLSLLRNQIYDQLTIHEYAN